MLQGSEANLPDTFKKIFFFYLANKVPLNSFLVVSGYMKSNGQIKKLYFYSFLTKNSVGKELKLLLAYFCQRWLA